MFEAYTVQLLQNDVVRAASRVGPGGTYMLIAEPGAYVLTIDPNPWQRRRCPDLAPCAAPAWSINVPADVTVVSGRVARFDIMTDSGIR